MTIPRLLTLSVLLAVALASCGPAAPGGLLAGSEGPRAWFDAPLPGTVFYPPNPCDIVAHGASPGGIASFELLINGAAQTIPSPDTQSSLVTLTRACGVSDPGEYMLQIRAQDNNGEWSAFADTSFVIAGAVEGPAPQVATPTLTVTPAPAGGVSIESITTDFVYFGDEDCGANDVTITARATTPQQIEVVVLFYRFSAAASSEFQSVAMNPIGGDLFQHTLYPTGLFGGAIPFDQATLQYQVVVQQANGDTSIRTPVLADIAMQACGGTDPCASWPDQRACLNNGCAWVSVPGPGDPHVCQSP